MASDVFGVSGLLMLQALVEGKASAQEMAELAKRQLRKKIPELELALEGKVEEHHRFLLRVLATEIIAEMGVDMSVFGNVSQLASWAGICPGNNESGGKRKSSRIPKAMCI